MPRTKKQFEQLRAEKKQRIMQIAMELFAELGYEQTSISAISKKADIAKGLLYNYFESKESLLKTIMETGLNKVYDSFDQNRGGTLSADELEHFIRHNFAIIKTQSQFFKLFYTLSIQPHVAQIAEESISAASQRFHALTYNYFKTMFDHPEAEFLLFTSLMKGLTIQYLFAHDHYSDDLFQKVIDQIVIHYKK